MGLLWRSNELTYIKHLEESLALEHCKRELSLLSIFKKNKTSLFWIPNLIHSHVQTCILRGRLRKLWTCYHFDLFGLVLWFFLCVFCTTISALFSVAGRREKVNHLSTLSQMVWIVWDRKLPHWQMPSSNIDLTVLFCMCVSKSVAVTSYFIRCWEVQKYHCPDVLKKINRMIGTVNDT
jgi:hypothetical protein